LRYVDSGAFQDSENLRTIKTNKPELLNYLVTPCWPDKPIIEPLSSTIDLDDVLKDNDKIVNSKNDKNKNINEIENKVGDTYDDR
jgi:hypothetical protein